MAYLEYQMEADMRTLIKTSQDFDEYSQYEFKNVDAIADMGRQLGLPSTVYFLSSKYMVEVEYWADSYGMNMVKIWVLDHNNLEDFVSAKEDLLSRDGKGHFILLKTLEDFMCHIGKEGDNSEVY